MSEFILKVNGENYGGWESFSIQRSIEQVSGIFRLEVTDRWALNQERRPINTDDECELIYINADNQATSLITGFVDEVGIGYDADSHTISISGRDKTMDIVDCSAQYRTGQIFDASILKVARLLTIPYGIEVSADANIGANFNEVTIDDGETIHEVIEKLARSRGVLLLSKDGRLQITEPSTERISTPLEFGNNIKSCDATFSTRERFHTYLVKAQSAADDSWPGIEAANPSATVTDTNARSPRLKIIVAEEGNNSNDCRKRGEWNRNVAIARSTGITYTVQGVEHSPGQLWVENKMVRVIDPYTGVNQDLLIVAVEYSKGDDGTNTALTVAPREAYTRQAVPEPIKEAF